MDCFQKRYREQRTDFRETCIRTGSKKKFLKMNCCHMKLVYSTVRSTATSAIYLTHATKIQRLPQAQIGPP